MQVESRDLEQVVQAVLASPKYRGVCEDFIREVAEVELAKRRNLKEVVKATKNKLHQVAGAYLGSAEDYAGWLEELREARLSPDESSFRQVCLKIMAHHSSTRERIPILDRFYSAIFVDLPPVRSVLDVACGLNPLSIHWMPLAQDAEYYAYDIYDDMMTFLRGFMEIAGVSGNAEARDVITSPPTQKVDVAFILKAIPCLEQVDKSAGLRLLEEVHADHLVVSFPMHSLGGRSKGMAANYERRLYELLEGKTWPVKKLEFATELVFVVAKS